MNSNANDNNTIHRQSMQLLAYADKIDIVARSIHHWEEFFTMLQKEMAKLSLKVNEDQTKYMVTAAGDIINTPTI